MKYPTAAALELRRCIQELGFKGALIDNNTEGRFYDDSLYWEVFQAAEELDVPIYLHPTYNDQVKPLLCDGNNPDAVAQTLATHAWGWHSETALHILRLFAAGLFDRFPRLKMIIGPHRRDVAVSTRPSRSNFKYPVANGRGQTRAPTPASLGREHLGHHLRHVYAGTNGHLTPAV